MNNNTSPNIFIIGAGPVGLPLACELARHGMRLVEKRPGSNSPAQVVRLSGETRTARSVR